MLMTSTMKRALLSLTTSGLAIASAVLLCGTVASAQSTGVKESKQETKPRVSVRMSDSDATAPSGGSLVVDFGKPAAAPEEKTPESAAPTTTPPVKPAVNAKVELPANLGQLCTTGDPALDALVLAASTRYGVDPCFVVAVIDAESSGERYAVSIKGACGYMQLMPDTARRFGCTDIFDARQNIFAGTQYLRWLLDRFEGSLELALAGYNAGENAVEKYGNRIPPYAETQNYVRKITGKYLTHRAGLVSIPAMPDIPQAAPLPPPQAPVVHSLVVDFQGAEKPQQ